MRKEGEFESKIASSIREANAELVYVGGVATLIRCSKAVQNTTTTTQRHGACLVPPRVGAGRRVGRVGRRKVAS